MDLRTTLSVGTEKPVLSVSIGFDGGPSPRPSPRKRGERVLFDRLATGSPGGSPSEDLQEGISRRSLLNQRMEDLMTSPARVAANVINAKKSTGPRTASGKERSRMNAVSHGLTARVALLSDESPAEFQERKNGWVSELKPRDQVELVMAERAFYHSWQLKRVMRAQWARLSFRAHTSAKTMRIASSRRLPSWAFGCFGGQARDRTRSWQGRVARAARRRSGSFDPADHPARLVGRLEGSGMGCQWLIDRFGELEAILESDQVWYAPERFRAFRLLRIHASDAYFDTKLACLMQACQVLDPERRQPGRRSVERTGAGGRVA